MRSRSTSLDSFGALIVLGIAIALSSLYALGVFQVADDYCNDFLAQTRSGTTQKSEVLLVHAPEEFFADPECLELLNISSELLQMRGKKVGLAFKPTNAQLRALEKSNYASSIIVGDALQSQIAIGNLELDSAPRGAVARGFLDLKMDQTVYRQHRIFVGDSDRKHRSFEFAISKQLLPSNLVAPEREIGIRFVGKSHSIPHVCADDVLNREIVAELVEDKVVLIGLESRNEIGFATPSIRPGERLSRLELRGNILNTLLNRNEYRKPGTLVSSLLILLLAFTGSLFFRQLSARQSASLAVGGGLLIVLGSWLTSQYLSFKLPVVPLLSAYGLSFFACIFTRFVTLKTSLENFRLLQQTNSVFGLSDGSDDYWALVLSAVYQTVYPQRLVIMELEPGANYLTVVKAVNCGEDEILERRRDIHRSPYKEAIEAEAPVASTSRLFFSQNHAAQEAVEYVVPMMGLSGVVGLMVLEMSTASLEKWDNFENFLATLAEEIATFVDESKSGLTRKYSDSKFLNRLKTVPEQRLENELCQNELFASASQALSNSFVESTQISLAIGDSFGRLSNVNPKMTALLQRLGVVVSNSSCVDVLQAITRLEKADCRAMIRRCIIDNESQKAFVGGVVNSTEPLLVYLEPLGINDCNRDLSNRFFSIQVVEGSVFKRSEVWKTDLEKVNAERLKMNLETLHALSTELVKRTKRQDQNAVRTMTNIISSCHELVDKGISEDPADSILFDTRSVWESALQSRQFELEKSCVKVVSRYQGENDDPGAKMDDMDLFQAVANPFLLERVFASILDCVSTDASENTEVQVEALSVDTKVIYSFRHNSGGVMEAAIPSAFKEDQSETIVGNAEAMLTSVQLDQFREIEAWLDVWDASLKIRCCDRFHLNIELELNSKIKRKRQSNSYSIGKNTELDVNES